MKDGTSGATLRLNMPQWQGGNDPCYHFGSLLLQWLAPSTTGPVETVPVSAPKLNEVLPCEKGVVARTVLLQQARAARAAIDKHRPARIVTLGGDCLVDLAPIAYLNAVYGTKLGVLWIDAHPDVMSWEEFPHAHAHVLGLLLGRGDPEFVRQIGSPIPPARVLYAGMDNWSDVEGEILGRLGLRNVPPISLADHSEPVLQWIRQEGIEHLAIHFDLDVLDPKVFRPLLFNKPSMPSDAFAGVPRGQMTPDQVVRLLCDVANACDIVGLAIAEHMPWDTLAMRNMLASLPLVGRAPSNL